MDWLRWHHGTVNDPKWRVIARKSGQPISLVLSVFASFLERASSSEDRGSIIGWSAEDIATCFDVDDADIISIHQALPVRLRHIATRCRVLPFPGIEFAIGRGDGIASDPEQRAERIERVETAVKSEREFIEVSL